MGKKEYKQLGTYGLIIKDGKILLNKKNGGPYDGKLDLPGGTIEFSERPVETLKRELMEEVGIVVKEFELFDADSVSFDWQFKEDVIVKVHHTGVFFKVNDYANNIKNSVEIDEQNDDSLGAEFYDIESLNKEQLSEIAILELEKLGYVLWKYMDKIINKFLSENNFNDKLIGDIPTDFFDMSKKLSEIDVV